MVITGLELPAGSHLVYLCAFMPEEGESATSLNERHPADLGRLLGTDESGDLLLVGDEIDELVWADAPAARASAARASLRSQGSVTLMESPPRVAWRDVPSTFVVARRDRVVHPDLQREMARRAKHVVEWDTSHMPMLSRPDRVIDLLNGLAVK
jgi:pimeloyl-ACP methyl ester carboxylesterase